MDTSMLRLSSHIQFPPPLPRIKPVHSTTISVLPRMSLAASSSDQTSAGSSNPAQIPKLEPFNRSRLSRWMPEPSLLEKTEHTLSDRCMALEGEEAYQCWEALFEFEEMKTEFKHQCDIAPSHEKAAACRPLERLENIVRQSNSIASLISNVKMLARNRKEVEAAAKQASQQKEDIERKKKAQHRREKFPEPAGLPPSEEELEVERSALMPESTYTRLLRRRGRTAAWFTHPPDHETD